MEQRPLRLGDLVDDYCPRERRVTNHAIVAIVNDSIRQTRCTTCDSEHVYKGGHAPRRRVRQTPHEDSVPENAGGQLVAPGEPAAQDETGGVGERAQASEGGGEYPAAPADEEVLAASGGPEPAASEEEDRHLWPANRQLIRATLPRSEGDVPPPRPIPEFTIYQRHNGRGRGGQQGRGWNDRGLGGNGSRGGDRRPGPGFGGQGQGRRRHVKRRPR
jgi:hypothetical protein